MIAFYNLICSGILHNDVLRYIAPFFGFDSSLIVNERTCMKCSKKTKETDGEFMKDKFYCNNCIKIFCGETPKKTEQEIEFDELNSDDIR